MYLPEKAGLSVFGAMITAIRRRLARIVWREVIDAQQLKAAEKELEALISLYETRSRLGTRAKRYPAECIVFSKDRALQLHALLASYNECVQPPVPVTVLYSSSNDRHQLAYDQVAELFLARPVRFVRQRSADTFGEQTLEILRHIQADKMFFLVDDNVFIDRVDITDFVGVDTERQVVSLRLGACLSRSYVVSKSQRLPPWLPGADTDRKWQLRWRWAEGQLEWGYPISLDGHLFGTDEVYAMARVVPFHSPNSLEANLQIFNRLFLRREGVCYINPIIVNIPCNRVQAEIPNRFGDIHQQMLLDAWHDGMCMDYRKLFGMRPESTHQDVEFSLVKRGEISPPSKKVGNEQP